MLLLSCGCISAALFSCSGSCCSGGSGCSLHVVVDEELRACKFGILGDGINCVTFLYDIINAPNTNVAPNTMLALQEEEKLPDADRFLGSMLASVFDFRCAAVKTLTLSGLLTRGSLLKNSLKLLCYFLSNFFKSIFVPGKKCSDRNNNFPFEQQQESQQHTPWLDSHQAQSITISQQSTM